MSLWANRGNGKSHSTKETASEQKVSDAVVARLHEWGVNRTYGYPGAGINGVMGALRRAKNRVEFIQVAHEELASMAACAHAKFTGEIGVCIATAGPGAIHLLNGLYDAKLDHAPVLAICGQKALSGLGGTEQQEVDLLPLLKNVAQYVELIGDPHQVHPVIDRAIRTALSERTVTAIVIPEDIQRKEFQPPERAPGMQRSGVGFSYPTVVPNEDDLRRAAEVLNAGNKVAMLVGAGALRACDEVIAVAERLGAGISKALLGKAAVPDDLSFVTGSLGWVGTRASQDMLMQCDTLLMVGSNFPYTQFLPETGKARGVQIDIDPSNLALRYPMEVALTGDSAATLSALLPLLTEKNDTSWRGQIERMVREWNEEATRHAHEAAPPINPQLAFLEVGKRLPDDCIVTTDSGSSAAWTARYFPMRRGMQFSVSGALATMGCATPYALAAKFAYPNRPVVASIGDGAMQMSGMNSLLDIAKYWRRWSDPRLVILVLNNQDLNYVTWEQRAQEGDPKFVESQHVPDVQYAQFAELIGLRGIRVERPERLAAACNEAFAADRPVVLEVTTNADVPTLPPRITRQLADNMQKALENGDPDASGVREQMRKQEVEVIDA
jgi:pyruvate dehydrogenase (quinone)